MDFQSVFQNLGFPVAICAVLVYACSLIMRFVLRQNDKQNDDIKAAYQNHLNDLQTQNSKLSNVIADNTKAFNELINLIKTIAKC